MAIPSEQNIRAVYIAAIVTGAPHMEAAQAWLTFILFDATFAVLNPFEFQRVVW